MSIDKGRMKIIAVYDTERDDFFVAEDEKLDGENRTYMIISEPERKITLSFPKNAGLIQKRTIERRMSSYLKVGFPIGDKGLRIGANFELEKIVADEKLPDILLTHGHSFGKGKLVRDEIPEYAEKEPSIEVDSSISPQVPTTPQPIAPQPIKSDTPTFETIASEQSIIESTTPKLPEYAVSETTTEIPPTAEEHTKNTSDALTTSEDEIYSLGEFVAMLVSQGHIVQVNYSQQGKFELRTVKEIQKTETVTVTVKKYIIEGTELYES
ncbi:MAG: hypothetical protein ACXAC7_02860 [Candidatus Hodarchaeales archaeon]|jgi:hypothetical protein